MANWMEGTFRARGQIENLKKFVLEGLRGISSLNEISVEFSEHNNGTYIEISGVDPHFGVALQSEKRQYICCGDDGFNIIKFNHSDEYYFATPYKAAWGIHRDTMLNLAKTYNIDIKVNGYERGMCAEEWYEVSRTGQVRCDSYAYYDDYGWEGTMPCLGG